MTYEILFNDASDNMGCLDCDAVKTITGIDTDKVRVDLAEGADSDAFEAAMDADPLIKSYTKVG